MKKTTEDRLGLQAHRGGWLQNFLDSAQNVLAEQLVKGLHGNSVNNMSSSDLQGNDEGAVQPVGSTKEKLYPNLEEENNQLSLENTTHSNFDDQGPRNPNYTKNLEEKFESQQRNSRQDRTNSGFDFATLGAGILEALAKRQKQQQGTGGQKGVDVAGFDVESLGTELWGLAEQVFHPDKQDDPQRTIERRPKEPGDNETDFGYGKIGSELLSSLAEQIRLHSNKNNTQPENQDLSLNQDSGQSGFDYDKVGSELLSSLAERMRLSGDQMEHASGDSTNPLGKDDIAAVLGSLAENVMKEIKRNQEQKKRNFSTHPPTIADSAGIVASSVLESFAEAVLHKYSDQALVQNKGEDASGSPGTGIQGYEAGPRGYYPNAQRSDFAQPNFEQNKQPPFSLNTSDRAGQSDNVGEVTYRKDHSEIDDSPSTKN